MILTHFNEDQRARTVDVSEKDETLRIAVASGKIYMSANTFNIIQDKKAKKGDVLSVAQIAGITGAKKTSELIPMCHNLFLEGIDMKFRLNSRGNFITAIATVKLTGKTGVEMEALTAVSTALLTIYDMVKAVDRDMKIGEIRLEEKSGGRSGHFIRKDAHGNCADSDESYDPVKKGVVKGINVSTKKGVKKTTVDCVKLVCDHGIEGDAHAGKWHRQVSLLSELSIDKMRGKGMELKYGDFAENITLGDIDLTGSSIGDIVLIGDAVLEVTQIGKECHGGCEIKQIVGDCVMPREGIFAAVLHGGDIKAGDEVTYIYR